MSFRRIGDVHGPCIDMNHNPPSHIVLPPGRYEYRCRSCGEVQIFTVRSTTCWAAPGTTVELSGPGTTVLERDQKVGRRYKGQGDYNSQVKILENF